MSTVRKQSIISSIVVYSGFALGLFNMYLFTKKGGFTEAEYGLTGLFIAFGSLMYSAANLGTPGYINKFFPYYQAHLKWKDNDLLTWALVAPVLAFGGVMIAGIAFKHILVDKIFNNSPELLQYYYWTFPFGLGFTVFMVLEMYAWHQRKAVLSNFSKEVLFRLFTTILILLTMFGILKSFSQFIYIYAFLYPLIALMLMGYFIATKRFHFVFKRSVVTRRFSDKILTLCGFLWGGGLVYNVAAVFDTIVVAAVLPNGVAMAAIFTFAQNLTSLIQAPQRAIISSLAGPLSKAWKEKDHGTLQRIYYRSSINQLLFSCAMFTLIWLNFEDGIYSFNLKESFLASKYIFLFMGLSKIIDMGSGVNSQIISTSNYWRFEFMSGLLLLVLALPLNYFLTQHYGLIGPALSNLIAFTVYNLIRYFFLLRKFGMQPFDRKSLQAVLLAIAVYLITYYFFKSFSGFGAMFLRSSFYLALFASASIALKLSPDIMPVLGTALKKLGLNKR